MDCVDRDYEMDHRVRDLDVVEVLALVLMKVSLRLFLSTTTKVGLEPLV